MYDMFSESYPRILVWIDLIRNEIGRDRNEGITPSMWKSQNKVNNKMDEEPKTSKSKQYYR